jgi:uncharacterized DUF497 family protein
MKFEHDIKKSLINKTKHGLSLEEARALWLSPFVEIEAKTVGEQRFMVIGKIGEKHYSCIYTTRGSVIRLISARRSRRSEEQIYNEHIKP